MAPASRTRRYGDWVWLEPSPRSLRVRQVGVAAALVVLAALGSALSALLPPAGGFAVVGAALAVTFPSLRWLWLAGSTRLAAFPEGILLQGGASSETLAWAALVEVRVEVSGRRARVLLRADDRSVAAPATFSTGPADQWMREAEALAPGHVSWRA